jgi:hypothetical protein
MLERLKGLGGTISAIVATVAAVVAIVKAVENAGHELPPILFALGTLAGLVGFTCSTLAFVWFAIRDRDATFLGTIASQVFALAICIWATIDADLFSTLFSGEYKGNSELLILAGSSCWLAVAYITTRMTIDQAKARKDPNWAPRGKKLCPECAESPKAAARVCRHCGHRFVSPTVTEPAPESVTPAG